jgi:uncharacterized protein
MTKPLIVSFGSRVSGKFTSASDFDFGVYTGRPLSLSERTDFVESISKKLQINEDKVDLIDLSSVSPLLKFEVAKKGQLIDGDTFDFIRFKVRAFKEYTDTAKFRRFREKNLMKNHV